MAVLESKESHEIKDLKIVIHEAVQAQNEFLKVQKTYIKALFWVTLLMAAATIAIAIFTAILATK